MAYETEFRFIKARGEFWVPPSMTHDEFLTKLYDFLESVGCMWGGKTEDEAKKPQRAQG